MEEPPSQSSAVLRKAASALRTMCAGDALAFPVHWYYSYPVLNQHLKNHYPELKHAKYYSVPAAGAQHPSSWKYYSKVETTEWKLNIWGGDESLWKVEGTHYHPNLAPGETTATTQLSLLLADCLGECDGSYDVDSFLRRYLAYFLESGNTDTYIETMHREFFKKMGDGVDPHNCFTEGESCLSALTLAFPVVLHGIVAGLPIETVHTRAVHHVGLFTRAPLINRRLRVLVWLVRELLEAGSEATASLRTAFEVLTLGQDAEVIGDIDNLLNKDDTDLFWGLERDALGKGECVLYLAIKYLNDPAKALAVNATLSGDNCHRGSLLGAILGCAGVELPVALREGLHNIVRIEATIKKFLKGCTAEVARSDNANSTEKRLSLLDFLGESKAAAVAAGPACNAGG